MNFTVDYPQPHFSVIIPVYNRADQIDRTLRSVWDQTFGDFEVVLVDDGSTDGLDTALQSHDDHRLRVIKRPNGGPSAARNTGFAESTGRYVAYLDSDDRWLPYHLETMCAEIAMTGADVLHGPMIVDRGVGRYAVKPGRAMHSRETFGHYRFVSGETLLLSTLVVARHIAEGVLWDERLTYGDADQYLHDLVSVVGPLHMIDKPTAFYNDITGPNKLSQLWVNDASNASYLNFFDWVEEHADDFSTEELVAHRARNLSGLESRPIDTIRMILPAYRGGTLSLASALRELIRARRPKFYRYLTDTFVYLRGQALSELRLDPPAHTSDRTALVHATRDLDAWGG